MNILSVTHVVHDKWRGSSSLQCCKLKCVSGLNSDWTSWLVGPRFSLFSILFTQPTDISTISFQRLFPQSTFVYFSSSRRPLLSLGFPKLNLHKLSALRVDQCSPLSIVPVEYVTRTVSYRVSILCSGVHTGTDPGSATYHRHFLFHRVEQQQKHQLVDKLFHDNRYIGKQSTSIIWISI